MFTSDERCLYVDESHTWNICQIYSYSLLIRCQQLVMLTLEDKLCSYRLQIYLKISRNIVYTCICYIVTYVHVLCAAVTCYV